MELLWTNFDIPIRDYHVFAKGDRVAIYDECASVLYQVWFDTDKFALQLGKGNLLRKYYVKDVSSYIL